MNYKTPILTEVLIKVLFEKGCLSVADIFDIVPKAKENGLSLIEIGQAVEIGLGGKRVEEEIPTPSPLISRIKCWNPEKTLLLQLSPDIIITNQVGEYIGWSEFKKFFFLNLDIVNKIIENAKYKSVLLQTNDSFSVEKEGFFLGQYLDCGGNKVPEWYKNSNEAADITLGRGFLEEDSRNRQIKIVIRKQKDSFSIKIDSKFHDKLTMASKLNEVVEKLHLESSASFESLITDKTRNEVMGGTV